MKIKLIFLAVLIFLFILLTPFVHVRNYNSNNNNPPTLTIVPRSTYGKLTSLYPSLSPSTPSAQPIQDVPSILFEISRSNIESANNWITITIAVAGILFTVILVIIAYLINAGLERAREAERITTSAQDVLNRMINQNQPSTSAEIPPVEGTQASPNFTPSNTPPTSNIGQQLTPEVLGILKQAHFETTYRLIFGSQLNILHALQSSPTHTITRSLAEAIHRRSKYNDISFEDYMQFLINAVLIGRNAQGEYYLTQLGYEFLTYLFQSGIPDKLE